MSLKNSQAESLSYLANIPVEQLKLLVAMAERKKEKTAREFEEDMKTLGEIKDFYFNKSGVAVGEIYYKENLGKFRAIVQKYPNIHFVQLYKIKCESYPRHGNIRYVVNIFAKEKPSQNIQKIENIVDSILKTARAYEDPRNMIVGEPNVTSFHIEIFEAENL